MLPVGLRLAAGIQNQYAMLYIAYYSIHTLARGRFIKNKQHDRPTH